MIRVFMSHFRQVLLGNKHNKTVRFSPTQEYNVDPSDLENGQILQLQQRIIEGLMRKDYFKDVIIQLTTNAYLPDQDHNLDQLSDAIRRQRELGLMIGDELDTHAQLIDETEAMVDRTNARLQKARRKLNYVGRKVKDNSKFQQEKLYFCNELTIYICYHLRVHLYNHRPYFYLFRPPRSVPLIQPSSFFRLENSCMYRS